MTKYYAKFNKEAMSVQKEIIIFWNSKAAYISKTIDMEKKYLASEPFDALKLLDEAVYSSIGREIDLVIKGIKFLTSKYFAYDSFSLLSKQIEQQTVIKEWIESNRDKVKIGFWNEPVDSSLVFKNNRETMNDTDPNSDKAKVFIDNFLEDLKKC
jgi:membrane-anchored glycerophosphoryl diester phosphodiesterase (GDPDase)